MRRKMTSTSSHTNDVIFSLAGCHFDKGDSVALIVGPEKRELLVHANYISRRSAFFEASLKKEWLEGQTRTVALPEDDYDVVTGYLKFIYSGRLDTPLVHVSTTNHTKEEHTAQFLELAKLYVLGNKLIDDDVKTAIIRELHGFFVECCAMKHCHCLPDHRFFNTIYSGTTTTDPLRMLSMSAFMSQGHTEDVSKQYHSDFTSVVLCAFVELATRDRQPKDYRWHIPDIKNYLK